MKKILLFACITATLIILFTACKKSVESEPEQPNAVLLDDYRYSSWRLDSIKSSADIPCPGAFIGVCSDTLLIINGDYIAYEYFDNKFTCRGVEYTVKTAKRDYAVLSNGTADFYLSRTPFMDLSRELSTSDPNNIIGTWKLLYYLDNIDSLQLSDYAWYRYARTNPGVETWELNIGNFATYHNYLTGEIQQGTWDHKPGYMEGKRQYSGSIRFVNNPTGKNEFCYIDLLTSEWMSLAVYAEDKCSQIWYFLRVK